MNNFPKQLLEFRFIKLGEKSKVAIETNWEETNNYPYSEVQDYQGNLGIVCGYGNLVVVDIDTKTDTTNIIQKLDNEAGTFSVKTGSNGRHYYFIVEDIDSTNTNWTRLRDNIGELRIRNSYVVVPGSIHPNGNRYDVYNDVEVRKVNFEYLLDLLDGYFIKKIVDSERIEDLKYSWNLLAETDRSKIEWTYLLELIREGNTKQECEHKFAFMEKAREKYKEGIYKEYFENQYNTALKTFNDEKPIVSEKSVEDYLVEGIPQVEWLVEGMIKKGGITLLTASPKSSKTLTAMYLASCVSNGEDFFENKTECTKVIYFDEEMGLTYFLDRMKRMKEGTKLSMKKIIPKCMEGLKLRGQKSNYWKQVIAEYVKNNEHILFIVDTCRRTLDDGKEDKSDDISEIFNTISPFKSKSSWLLLHHTTWDGKRARGSSDWEAFPDNIFNLERKGKDLFVLSSKAHRGTSQIDGIRYRFTGTDKEPIKVEFMGNKLYNENSIIHDTAIEIATWLNDSKIGEFKRAQIKEQFKNIPYTRVTNALNMLCEQDAIGSFGEGKSTYYKCTNLKEYINKNVYEVNT